MKNTIRLYVVTAQGSLAAVSERLGRAKERATEPGDKVWLVEVPAGTDLSDHLFRPIPAEWTVVEEVAL